MSGKVAVCTVCPKENQQIEAIIKLPVEKRAVIHGTVLDANGNPVADAVVKLLQVVDGCKLPYPLTHTFTDQYGQFLLGPLCPNVKYMLKVYKDTIKIKCLPLDVDCYEGKCIGVKNCPPCQPKSKEKYSDFDNCDC
ncbi:MULTISPECIES: carboxypeptidase-like regulatory domain-containing protein [Clostridium]|uniref:carboxypeptidase-like regulatory domain-containing protein n=1 Tax=Clostridium TaxID=1485 RepID=UPI001FAB2540|nr:MULTISPECIES: carboxypeptidase-like regulatory domain-containing protein [Clostridium]